MKYLYVVLICIFIIVIISIIYSAIKIDVSHFLIKNKKIDKNMKIMFLSDLHNRNIIPQLEKIINREIPDLIVLGGDMINEYIKETDNFIKLINILNKYKTYYVFGNHEEKMNPTDKIEYHKRINSSNIILLNNDSIRLTNNIKLTGLNCDITKYIGKHVNKLTKEYIIDKAGQIDDSLFNILVAHNPLEFECYCECNYDLVLSGHIHGGVIKIPFIGGLLSPDYTFFPKYYQGKTINNNTSMIVSRGLGFSKRLHFRINNPGEVVIINLEKE